MTTPDQPEYLPIESTFMGFLDQQFYDEGPDTLSCRVAVRDDLRQPMGIVHGGIYCAIAESIASMGAGRSVGMMAGTGKVVMGQQNNTTFLRPVTGGTIRAVGRMRHGGRTTQVWQIDMFDDADRLCAVSQVTMAVRDRR